jgi:hypothetical protein
MVPSALSEPPPAVPSRKATQDAAWNSFFARLLDFKRLHGHYDVPRDAEHASLFNWTAHQRSHLNTGRLRAERREYLLAAGFPGERRSVQKQAADRIWNRHFAELMAFHQQHGHFKIPYKDANYKFLWEWLNHMRRKKASGRLQPDREQRLEAAGFPWSGRTPKSLSPKDADARLKEIAQARWEKKFDELRTFHLAHGHFNVPEGLYRFRGSLNLSGWILRQRRNRKLGRLPPEQEQRLTALGFPWEPECPESSAHGDLAKKIPGAETSDAGLARL